MKMKLTYPITLSHHGAYRQYNKLTLWLEKFINDNWEHISKMFQLPEEINIRLRPLPCNNTHGHAGTRRIMLNVAKGSIKEIVRTLMHELRHVEQYHTGRMKDVFDGVKHTNVFWDGVNCGRMVPYHPKLVERYMAQPWEVDARSVEEPYVAALEEAIGTKLPEDRTIPE